jgi:hypothetical protein
MTCSIPPLENIYFWLFFLSFFLGTAAASIPAAGRRLTGALFFLIPAAASLLAAVVFVDLASVAWGMEHPAFGLFFAFSGFIIWWGKKYFAIPILLILLLFSVQLNRGLSGWVCAGDGAVLGEFRTGLVEEERVGLELLSVPEAGGRIDIDSPRPAVRYLRLIPDPRLFFLPTAGYVKLEGLSSWDVPEREGGRLEGSLVDRLLSYLGLWLIEEGSSSRSELVPLSHYRIVTSASGPDFEVDIITVNADR